RDHERSAPRRTSRSPISTSPCPHAGRRRYQYCQRAPTGRGGRNYRHGGEPQRLTPLINAAEEKGIRVVCLSTDAPESRRSSIVCVEPRLNGCLAGELMGKFVPPGSKVAVVAGMLSAEDHRKKTDGFSEAFPRHCPGGK